MRQLQLGNGSQPDAISIRYNNDMLIKDINIIKPLNGASADYFSEVSKTKDGGYLLLWSGFSASGIIIEPERSASGQEIKIPSKGWTGYIFKCNSDDKIEWIKNIDGKDIQQTKDGGYIISISNSIRRYDSNFNLQWEYPYITNDFDIKDGEIVTVGSKKINNIETATTAKIKEIILAPEVPPKQNLEITNTKKSYRIKTKVATHTEIDSNGNEIEVQGGTISGNGLGYYEEVKYKEDSIKDIIITPDEGYKVASITVNGQDFGFTLNEDGKTVLLSKFLEVIENKEVIVKFEKVETSVLVHHYLWDETNGLTTNRIADDEFISGKVGESYTTSPKVGLGNYELVTNANILGETTENPEDYYIPENAIGTFADEQTEVIYYYKEKTYKLTVHHYLDGTTDKLAEDEIIEKFVSGSEYATTKSSSIDRKYKVVLVVGNEAGIITEDTEVTYYYIDTSIDITANKVWQDTLGIARPDEITIALVGTNLTTNEQEYYEEQILSKENNWSYSWADLYVDTETGERINYKVLELTELEDYYLLGIEEKNNTFTITNRFKISLPNSGGSGIKNIILIGIFVVGIGVILIRKNKIMVIIPKNKKTTRKNKKRRKARIARKR